MKNLFSGARRRRANYFPYFQSLQTAMNRTFILWSVGLMGIVFAACQKGDINPGADEIQSQPNNGEASESNTVNGYSGLSSQTIWELIQARAATARYRQIKNAIKDGYADINVVVPNMGFHYMKAPLVDATFEIRKPEILVYNKNHDGRIELVAVEYAVPISATPAVAPSGFSGSGDVWDRNTGFGLWLLHAWVWSYNPDGVFNPTNPLVHLH